MEQPSSWGPSSALGPETSKVPSNDEAARRVCEKVEEGLI